MSKSHLEATFLFQIRAAGLPEPEREVRLVPTRRKNVLEVMHNKHEAYTRHRVDFVWRRERIVFEVQGGTTKNGRHNRAKGYEEDCRKMAWLQLESFTVYYATSSQINSGEALHWLAEALQKRQTGPHRNGDSCNEW